MNSQYGMLFPLLAVLVIWYFMIIRPQMKKQKAHRELVASIKKGDKIIMENGIYGKVASTDDENNTAVVEIASGVNITIVKTMVRTVTRG